MFPLGLYIVKNRRKVLQLLVFSYCSSVSYILATLCVIWLSVVCLLASNLSLTQSAPTSLVLVYQALLLLIIAALCSF